MVTASASSGLTYNFQSGNTGDQFYINPHSGVVSLATSLDRERRSEYQLVVSCVSTEGMEARSRVIVHVTDVNDNRYKLFKHSRLWSLVFRFDFYPSHVKVIISDEIYNAA